MTVVEDAVPGAAFSRAGLPRGTVAAWLESSGVLNGDYGRDSENFSRQWRIGAELIAKLPRKPDRSEAQAAAATAILQRDRAARETFLGAHTSTRYIVLALRTRIEQTGVQARTIRWAPGCYAG